MRHGIDLFHDILGSKDIIKCFIHRGEDARIGGYLDGSAVWCVVDRRYSASKWGWIFPSAEGRWHVPGLGENVFYVFLTKP